MGITWDIVRVVIQNNIVFLILLVELVFLAFIVFQMGCVVYLVNKVLIAAVILSLVGMLVVHQKERVL